MQEKYKVASEYCAAYTALVEQAIELVSIERNIHTLDESETKANAYESAAVDIIAALYALVNPEKEECANADIQK